MELSLTASSARGSERTTGSAQLQIFCKVHVFPRLQIRSLGIVADIRAEIIEIFLAADQMIKLVFLPKPPFPAKTAIDLDCCEVFPRIALLKHAFFRREGGK